MKYSSLTVYNALLLFQLKFISNPFFKTTSTSRKIPSNDIECHRVCFANSRVIQLFRLNEILLFLYACRSNFKRTGKLCEGQISNFHMFLSLKESVTDSFVLRHRLRDRKSRPSLTPQSTEKSCVHKR